MMATLEDTLRAHIEKFTDFATILRLNILMSNVQNNDWNALKEHTENLMDVHTAANDSMCCYGCIGVMALTVSTLAFARDYKDYLRLFAFVNFIRACMNTGHKISDPHTEIYEAIRTELIQHNITLKQPGEIARSLVDQNEENQALVSQDFPVNRV